MIHSERIRLLNERDARRGKYVLYWMQQSQRAACNHALEHAVRLANERNERLVVLFGLTDRFPEANLRHDAFMLEGLRETAQTLRERGIAFVVRRASPDKAAVEMAEAASLIVTDCGYLRVQADWRARVARKAPCRVAQVEGDVVVPVEVASDKEEYAARTIRPKIQKRLKHFLQPLKETPIRRDSLGLRLGGEKLNDPAALLRSLRLDRSVKPTEVFRCGTGEARRLLKDFIARKLNRYDTERNDPSLDVVSHMSPYLHFGQISPLEVALAVRSARGKRKAAKDAFLEELIVRRELSMNFVHYNWGYDAYEALPAWARRTLARHARDRREVVYSDRQFERAQTHDPYWNAAQRQMVLTGKMHNYMRMYWGKKILEWSATPEAAFRTALRLNNKYELDGRDANSFAGVAWCFGKHDRPWTERPVFGNVRYMNAAGLERKFDMNAYARKIEALEPKGRKR